MSNYILPIVYQQIDILDFPEYLGANTQAPRKQ